MPKRRCWNPLERKKYMPKPCEHQQVLCPSHCETVAGKMPKRRCWNPLKRERNRARTAARFVLESRSSSPPPFDHNLLQQLPRRTPPHSDEGLLLEPTKNKEKRLPQARQTFAQRKTWKPASHQAKLKKKVFGTRMRKGRTPAGLAPKPLRNRSRKNLETSLLEPTKNKEI